MPRSSPLAAAVAPTTGKERRKERAEFSRQRAYEAAPSLDASDEDKANYVLARYAVQNDHYAGLYRQWAKPIFFLVGKHWLVWDPRKSNYDLDTDVPDWRQQPVTNYTYAVFRTAISKLTKAKPTFEVVPPSGDSEDRDSAKLGESILEFLWRYLKTPQKVIRAIGWLLCAGKVHLRTDWDPEAGEVKPRTVLVEVVKGDGTEVDAAGMPLTEDIECACDEQGEPYRRPSTGPEDVALDGGDPYDLERQPELEPTGEIVFDVVDPMCVRLNPEATSDEEAEEQYIARLVPVSHVAERFECDEKDLIIGATDGSTGDDSREELETLLSSITAGPPDPFNQPLQRTGSSQDEGIGERVLVIEYYRKPNRMYPEGRHWITAGGKKVWPKADDPEYPDGEAPLPFGFWPNVVTIVDTPIPGQPDGVGLLSQVVPLNEQLNHLDGKVGEYHVAMAMGGVIWVHPADKGITITSEPGQVKVSKGYGIANKPPMREKLEALPGQVYAERDVITGKLRSIAGFSEVDMGQKPEGVTAGRAFLVLQEASDAPFMPLLYALEEALCEIGRRQLVIAQRMYSEERTLKIRGANGQWEFRAFKGADLRDGLDVRVQVGSMYPWSKSAQWDTKLSLIQALPQLVMKPDGVSVDEQKLARYLDSGVPGLKAFESQQDPDLVEIDREHAMFEAYDPTDPSKSNQLPQLAFWQNLPTHQEHHYNFLKRDYARFQRWSTAAQEAFLEHIRLTTEAVDQLAAAMTGGLVNTNGGAADTGEVDPATGKPMALVPPGGSEGRLRTPSAAPQSTNLRLTRADRAAAGQ